MRLRHKDFEDFLMHKCMTENLQVLDDDGPDFFDDWLCDLQADDFIKYGNEYAASVAPNEPRVATDATNVSI